MQIKDFLEKVCNEIKYRPIRQEIGEELQNHMEEAKEEYLRKGENEEMAINKVITEMGDAESIGKSLNKIHKPRVDYKLIILVMVLLCFTFLVTVIKTQSYAFSEGERPFFMNTIVYLIIGSVLSLIIYFMDYTKILKYSNHIYIACCLLIIYTVQFSNYHINGIPHLNIANIFVVSISTVTMPLFIIAFVGFIQNIRKNYLEIHISNKKTVRIDKDLIKIVLLSILSLLLLASIPSFTSAFVLGITYLIIATVKIIKDSDRKIIHILKLWGIALLISIFVIVGCYIRTPYNLERIITSFQPENDPEGGGWLGINRNLVIHSANIIGEANDMGNAMDIFDEGSEYAFISILAHYGWIIAISLVITIILISIKLIINSIQVKESYGKILIVGISCLFILQSIFNVLMNLNLWIEAGFELPFVSYGGTGLIMNMLCLALILSIYRKKDILGRIDNKKIVVSNCLKS